MVQVLELQSLSRAVLSIVRNVSIPKHGLLKVAKNLVKDLSAKPYIVGLSVLGGEPLHPVNIDTVIAICKTFKEKYPEKSIWLWSGYRYEEIVNKDILNYLDVLIDGKFIYDLRDFKLMYRGSSNQRVIDVKESLKQDKIVLMEVDK